MGPCTTVILRSTDRTSTSVGHADFAVRLPPHARPQDPFMLKLVSAFIELTGADAPVSVHCSLGSGSRVVDTKTNGSSDCVAVMNSTLDNVESPPIECPGAGQWNEIAVVLRDPKTYAVRSDVSHCTLVFTLHELST